MSRHYLMQLRQIDTAHDRKHRCLRRHCCSKLSSDRRINNLRFYCQNDQPCIFYHSFIITRCFNAVGFL